MTASCPTRTALVLLGLAVAAGCASSASPAGSGAEEGARPRASTGEERPGASLERLEEIYRARQDSALLRVSEADVDFVTGMIAHHAQALVMSALAPRNDASPTIRTLAARIVNAQRDEIANMQRWLRDRGRPVPEVAEDGTMPGMAGEHAMHMPGMLTPEQMRTLAAARGADFDRTFLELMIQHHQGAVTMVHELFATDGAAQDEVIFRLASDIQVDQITEINRMRQMLEAMPAASRRR